MEPALVKTVRTTLVQLDDLIADLLPLIEPIQAGALNSGDVNENIRPAFIGLNETIALLTIEPFYSAGSHCKSLSQSLVGHHPNWL